MVTPSKNTSSIEVSEKFQVQTRNTHNTSIRDTPLNIDPR